MKNQSDNQDFRTTASLQTLQQRAEIIKKIRNFFDSRNFLEVETPILSHDTVVDRYLEPIGIDERQIRGTSDGDRKLWLQTSPEFGMKRILACGAEAIYQITKSFRSGEIGRLHNPEFTMLEWYRAGDDQESGIKLLGNFIEEILGTRPHQSISYRQAFLNHANLDPFDCEPAGFRAAADAHGVDVTALNGVDDIDQWRNVILTEVIESKLGQQQPEIVFDWPASQSALAIARDENPPLAERFELYFNGIELANGYHELLDSAELLARNQKINAQRTADGSPALPENSRLLTAMQSGLPACAGVALGVDRLIMLATGKTEIKQVMAFDFDRA